MLSGEPYKKFERREYPKPTIDINPLDDYDTVRVNFPETSHLKKQQITFSIEFPKTWDEVPIKNQPKRKFASNPYDHFLMSSRNKDAFKACGGTVSLLPPNHLVGSGENAGNEGNTAELSLKEVATTMGVTQTALLEAYALAQSHYLSKLQSHKETRRKAA